MITDAQLASNIKTVRWMADIPKSDKPERFGGRIPFDLARELEFSISELLQWRKLGREMTDDYEGNNGHPFDHFRDKAEQLLASIEGKE